MKEYLDKSGLQYLWGKISNKYYKKEEVDKMVDLWYGIEWTDANTVPVRIGNMSLHRSLPIQNKMRRCVLNDDGSVNYYLDANDSTKKEDGTDAVLDGTDGQVMVEIPEYYYQAYDIPRNDTVVHRLVLYPISNTGIKSKKIYVGAYEGNISSNMLCSTCNTEFTSSGVWDDSGTKLLPTTNKTRAQFRTAASSRGTGWSQQYWDAYMSIVRLYVVEYCNFNTQATYYSTLTDDGYRKGGLGSGVSTASNWDTISYRPFIPCGITNELGNSTGVVSTIYTSGTMSFNGQVPSYRGIENPFGHIWKWTDGININTTSGQTTVYTCSDITKFADSTSTNYTNRITFAKPANGYISKWNWDEYGDFIPKATGGSSITGLCDYSYWNDGWKVLRSGGRANNDARCGWFYFNANSDASFSDASIGGRLYFTE